MRSKATVTRLRVSFVRALLALVFMTVAGLPRMGHAGGGDRRHAEGPYLAIAGGVWSMDLIGIADGAPRPHGHAGGQAELGWLWGSKWATSASFRWGGSWFNFEAFANVPLGHVNEETWTVRLVADHRLQGQRGRSAWLGIGILYGEARTDINTITFARDPPPTFLAGGLIRAGAGFPVGGPFEVFGELEEALFRGRGGDPDFQEHYRWLGRAMAGHAGIRVARHGD